jgi:cell division septum initiation protein DivIVA
MVKKIDKGTTTFKRRLLGYRRKEVDAGIAFIEAELARRTEGLELEVGRLTEELAVATAANEDLAFRATRRAVETILREAATEAAGPPDETIAS